MAGRLRRISPRDVALLVGLRRGSRFVEVIEGCGDVLVRRPRSVSSVGGWLRLLLAPCLHILDTESLARCYLELPSRCALRSREHAG